MAKGAAAKRADLRLLAIAHDPDQPDDVRAAALTDYARSKRTLSAELARLRRQLIATMAHAGQVRQAVIARRLEIDHARVSRLLAQAGPEGER